jgi:hypothetical protein
MAIGLPQNDGKGHQKFTSLTRAEVDPSPQKKSASTGMLAQLKSAVGKDLIEY